jgi:hypothetical protein
VSPDRKQNREAAQKVFNDACRGANLSQCERREFSNYMHNKNLLEDYMDYRRLRNLAEEWQRSAYNPCKY